MPDIETSDTAFALAGMIGHAKSISDHADRIRFLRGCLRLIGDAPQVEHLRLAVAQMQDSDEQLDLIERQNLVLSGRDGR